jgi:PUA domain protein
MGNKTASKRSSVNRKMWEQISERIRKSLIGISYVPHQGAMSVEVVNTRKSKVFFLNREPLFIERRNRIVPSLINEDIVSRMPSVVVDQGAVPFLCTGANVMAPGVREVEGKFSPGQLVIVREERFHKGLVVGSAIVGSDEMKKQLKGRVVENIHYVGDDAWEILTYLAP